MKSKMNFLDFLNKRKEEIFSKLTKSDKPRPGCIAGWVNLEENIYHAAVITGINPLTVAMRNGSDGPFYPNESFDYTNNQFSNYLVFKEIRYFIPSKLQKIINPEASN